MGAVREGGTRGRRGPGRVPQVAPPPRPQEDPDCRSRHVFGPDPSRTFLPAVSFSSSVRGLGSFTDKPPSLLKEGFLFPCLLLT